MGLWGGYHIYIYIYIYIFTIYLQIFPSNTPGVFGWQRPTCRDWVTSTVPFLPFRTQSRRSGHGTTPEAKRPAVPWPSKKTSHELESCCCSAWMFVSSKFFVWCFFGSTVFVERVHVFCSKEQDCVTIKWKCSIAEVCSYAACIFAVDGCRFISGHMFDGLRPKNASLQRDHEHGHQPTRND